MHTFQDVIALALSSCPSTQWKAEPLYDYPDQRYSLETMERQLIEQANSSKSKLESMLKEWGLTGRWPKARNAPVYFLRELLFSASHREKLLSCKKQQLENPPWPPETAERISNLLVNWWYNTEMNLWASDLALNEFKIQELIHSAHNSLE